MLYFAPERIGPTRRKTPEGFLLCEGVPIARTGVQIYRAEELPDGLTPDSDGIIRVERDPGEVFAPEAVASANGKALVNEHPDDDVTPQNWRTLAMGVALRPRRGENDQEDLLLADLLWKDPDAIALVESGKKDISCGYACEYDDLGPGKARQRDIRINHVALVDNGRCGPRCSIGDRNRTRDCSSTCSCQQRKEPDMAKPKSVADWFRRVRATKDDAEAERMAQEAEKDGLHLKDEAPEGEPGHHVHVHVEGKEGDSTYCTRDEFEAHVAKNETEHKEMRDSIEALKAELAKKGETATGDDKEVEGELEEEAPEGTGDAAKKAKDSAYLVDAYRETTALAEVIVPGIALPSFDKAAAPKTTLDSIKSLRRKTLDLAYNTQPDSRDVIDTALGGKRFDSSKLTRDSLRSIFRSVGSVRRQANNRDDNGGGGHQHRSTPGTSAPMSPAEINRAAKAARSAR